MDINGIATIIGSLGFPIVACIGLGWYVKYQSDVNTKEISNMRKEHQEEIAKVTEALNNNTLALQRLCDKLEKEDKSEK